MLIQAAGLSMQAAGFCQLTPLGPNTSVPWTPSSPQKFCQSLGRYFFLCFWALPFIGTTIFTVIYNVHFMGPFDCCCCSCWFCCCCRLPLICTVDAPLLLYCCCCRELPSCCSICCRLLLAAPLPGLPLAALLQLLLLLSTADHGQDNSL